MDLILKPSSQCAELFDNLNAGGIKLKVTVKLSDVCSRKRLTILQAVEFVKLLNQIAVDMHSLSGNLKGTSQLSVPTAASVQSHVSSASKKKQPVKALHPEGSSQHSVATNDQSRVSSASKKQHPAKASPRSASASASSQSRGSCTGNEKNPKGASQRSESVSASGQSRGSCTNKDQRALSKNDEQKQTQQTTTLPKKKGKKKRKKKPKQQQAAELSSSSSSESDEAASEDSSQVRIFLNDTEFVLSLTDRLLLS